MAMPALLLLAQAAFRRCLVAAAMPAQLLLLSPLLLVPALLVLVVWPRLLLPAVSWMGPCVARLRSWPACCSRFVFEGVFLLVGGLYRTLLVWMRCVLCTQSCCGSGFCSPPPLCCLLELFFSWTLQQAL